MFTRNAVKIDSENSISELLDVTIGGMRQWVYIRGLDKNKPVLLMLHGGPGSGQIGFVRKMQAELERHYIVVNWDQRGAGLSYSKQIPQETMNINQFVEDTLELTRYLCGRFGREQIYLLGHSWGTVIGMLAIARSPQLYKRYFGVSQLANYVEGEQLSYAILLEKSRSQNNRKAYSDLSRIGPPPWSDLRHDRVHQKYLDSFGGGISHDGKMVGTIIKELLKSKEYTLTDAFKHVKGQLFSMKHLQQELREIDFKSRIHQVEIPVHFCMGRHDLMIPYQQSEEFFNLLKAPEKHWTWFEHSAHSPHFEEREKFASLIVEETNKDGTF
ncbi:alpha/beta fold hydrolase [Paenibacillus thermotolerans]|uniref:alpha/beta fold hydrolase n=1 Tax=Paenibacillus thermotolerans TaxID=3027807 RepID=UPI00236887A7|nr:MULTISPECIES: alpha/beta hydrolase [unclassified Paenibacillus]